MHEINLIEIRQMIDHLESILHLQSLGINLVTDIKLKILDNLTKIQNIEKLD